MGGLEKGKGMYPLILSLVSYLQFINATPGDVPLTSGLYHLPVQVATGQCSLYGY